MLDFFTVAEAKKQEILKTYLQKDVVVDLTSIIVSDLESNEHFFTETYHPELTKAMNRSNVETSFIVTRTHYNAANIVFHFYIQSVSYKERIIKFKWKYSQQSRCFLTLSDDIYLIEGFSISKRDKKMIHGLLPVIESHLLHLPEFRLRFVTGELIQVMELGKV